MLVGYLHGWIGLPEHGLYGLHRRGGSERGPVRSDVLEDLVRTVMEYARSKSDEAVDLIAAPMWSFR